MDEAHAPKRSWENSSSDYHTSIHPAWRPNLPVNTSRSTLQNDTLPTTSAAGPKLPPITTTLGNSEMFERSESNSARRTFDNSGEDYTIPRLGSSQKRQRLSYDDYTSTYADSEAQPYQVPEDTGARSLNEGLFRTQSKESNFSDFDKCSRCGNLESYIEKVVFGLIELEQSLRRALIRSFPEHHARKEGAGTHHHGKTICDKGLEHSLEWSINAIESSIRLSRESSATLSLPRSDSKPVHLGSEHESPAASATPWEGQMRRPSSVDDRSFQLPPKNTMYTPTSDGIAPFPPDYPPSMPVEQSFLPNDLNEVRMQQPTSLNPSRHISQSPGLTATSSVASVGMHQGSVPSPSQSARFDNSGRVLPSPSSLHFPRPSGPSQVLPPILSQSPPPHETAATINAAGTAHMQDMQHQISKQSLALSTLQREHETLLAAYARQQTRCVTLDKKTRVAEHEINALTEERFRLQAHVESLEGQAEDLTRSRDEARIQNASNGAQYMQIMTMSSRLQAQAAEEARRWKVDRENWEEEKLGLTSTIQKLENERSNQARVKHNSPLLSGREYSGHGDITSDPTKLRSENAQLKSTIESLEKRIQQMTIDAEEIDRVMNTLGRIRSLAGDTAAPSNTGGEATGSS